MASKRPDARSEFNPAKQAAETEVVAVRISADALGLPSVPDHDLIRRIGCGAFGEVWLARNVVGTPRAVKVVHRRSFSEVYPFDREFNGIQKYEPISRSHEGLVDILQIGRNEAAGYFYYVMELADTVSQQCSVSSHQSSVPGTPSALLNTDHCSLITDYSPCTLRAKLKTRGALPADEVLTLGVKLTAALAHLHGHGLVHRDIKPSNIIFVNGAPKLADIGLVADLDEARSFVGTIGFIPPEGPGTAQADVYGLGKVLYEALTGRDRQEFPALPEEFLGTESPLDGRSQNESDPASMKRLVAGLNQVILRACESDPRRRYPSAQAMGDELHRLERGESISRTRGFRRWFSLGKKAGLTLSAMVGRRDQTDVSSGISEVNHLVEKGHVCALGATQERLRQAAKYFADAAALAPGFLPALVGLFRVRLLELTALPQPLGDTVANIHQAAAKLIEAAPHLAENLTADSLLRFLEGRLPDALSAAQTAARMPSCCKQTRAVVHALNGVFLLNSGRPEAALRHFKLSEREVPTCAIVQVYLGHPRFVRRQFDLALAQYQNAVELEPRQCLGHSWKAKVLEEKSEILQAIEESEQAELRALEDETRLIAATPSTTVEAITGTHERLRESFLRQGVAGYWRQRLENALSTPKPNAHYISTVLARLGQVTEAYEWLAKALEQGELNGLCFNLCWDRRDRRFRRIASQVGLV